eukprot:11794761-Heterocapsa_arctica.AAC.1
MAYRIIWACALPVPDTSPSCPMTTCCEELQSSALGAAKTRLPDLSPQTKSRCVAFRFSTSSLRQLSIRQFLSRPSYA